MSQEILDKLKQSIIDQNISNGIEAAKEAVAAGVDSMEAVEKGLAEGMAALSELFDEGAVFVPQLLLAAKAFEASVEILTENLSAEDRAKASRGKVLICTVDGDIHSIGKGIVGTMLGASGYEIIDIGVSVTSEDVVAAAQKENADIIALSALMTTTMPAMQEIDGLLKEAGIRDQFKLICGGAPVSEEWCMDFSDGYCESAAGAPRAAADLMAAKGA